MTTTCKLEMPVRRDGQPPFSEAWQAQVLAMADSLRESGLFTASEWSDQLGLELKKADQAMADDDLNTYFNGALNALEVLVASHSVIDSDSMQSKRKDWELAYLSTPHGQPVILGANDQSSA
jgi:nitrile hydratase accessory protein